MRFVYRAVVWLHPLSFRDQFGDEMLCIFDETEPVGALALLVDGSLSVFRQWLLRSGAWKMALGAMLSATLLFACAYFNGRSQTRLYERLAAHQPHPPALDRDQFNRDAAAAVAMLVRFREQEHLQQPQDPLRHLRSDAWAPHDVSRPK